MDTVGDDDSSLDSQFYCFLTSVYPLPLIIISLLLSFRSIRYARLFLCCVSTTLWSRNCCNYFHSSASTFFTKNFDTLFNNVLGQDGTICDDVGWWGGLNKDVDSI